MKSYDKSFSIFIIAFLISIPLSILLSGYTISTLWLWFVVPLGFPALGIANALGISLLLNVLRPTDHSKIKNKIEDYKENNNSEVADEAWKALTLLYSRPAAALLVGYIFTLFM